MQSNSADLDLEEILGHMSDKTGKNVQISLGLLD